MMKVTAQHNTEAVTLKLEGALAGEWVEELLSCWKQSTASCEQVIKVDLSEVTWISSAGCELLALMYRNGAELVASDLLMRAIVEEIISTNQRIDLCLTERRQ